MMIKRSGGYRMNFIFISPNFPKTYWNFCRGLMRNGVRVLGIGDAPYEQLQENLKQNLTEYYKVGSLENEDEVYRACAYFAFRYGRIDWIESNNEYWLMKDAALRTDFNVTSGVRNEEIAFIKMKSRMKEMYAKASVPTARWHTVSTLQQSLDFVAQVGWPVVVKPDNGVGANATWKLENEEQLRRFFQALPPVPYIMEEYIPGTIESYDGIAGRQRQIIFETTHVFPRPIMEIVNHQEDIYYYSRRQIPQDLREMGRRVVATFPTQSRFFHCEFFRLNEDKPGLGKRGDLVGLEVNMRPPGGYTPDMMNYANDIDVYQIWANMIAFGRGDFDPDQRPYFCVYAGRRDGLNYRCSLDEVVHRWHEAIVMKERMPEVLAGAMGNEMLTARFSDEAEMMRFVDDALGKAE